MSYLKILIFFIICGFALIANATQNQSRNIVNIANYKVSKIYKKTPEELKKLFGNPADNIKLSSCSDGSNIISRSYDTVGGEFFVNFFHNVAIDYVMTIYTGNTTIITVEEALSQLGISSSNVKKTAQTPPEYENVCVRRYKVLSGKFEQTKIMIEQDGDCDLAKSPVTILAVKFDNMPKNCNPF